MKISIIINHEERKKHYIHKENKHPYKSPFWNFPLKTNKWVCYITRQDYFTLFTICVVNDRVTI